MSDVAAPAAPATPAAKVDNNVGTLTERVMATLDDDGFDFGNEGIPDEPGTISDLKPEDFDVVEEDDGSEDTKPETPKKKDKPTTPPRDEEPAPPPKAEAKPVLPADRGTEDKPYGINDLPADKFLKVKIDGKEQTLPLREIADGYIRKQTFDSALSKAKQSFLDAQRIAEGAVKMKRDTIDRVEAFLSNPEQLFNYMKEHDPEGMLKFGSMIGDLWGQWSENPALRQRHEYERQQRQLAVERERVANERQQWDREQERRRATEQNNQLWTPVWREALKEAGFPKITPEFRHTVEGLVYATEKASGGKITPEAFKACVLRAAKLSGAETVAARTPAPQAAPAPKDPAERKANGKRKWDDMSSAAKFRDPDYFLRR